MSELGSEVKVRVRLQPGLINSSPIAPDGTGPYSSKSTKRARLTINTIPLLQYTFPRFDAHRFKLHGTESVTTHGEEGDGS
jgi:hypothetical protein